MKYQYRYLYASLSKDFVYFVLFTVKMAINGFKVLQSVKLTSANTVLCIYTEKSGFCAFFHPEWHTLQPV
jgi:hypothetical protein